MNQHTRIYLHVHMWAAQSNNRIIMVFHEKHDKERCVSVIVVRPDITICTSGRSLLQGSRLCPSEGPCLQIKHAWDAKIGSRIVVIARNMHTRTQLVVCAGKNASWSLNKWPPPPPMPSLPPAKSAHAYSETNPWLSTTRKVRVFSWSSVNWREHNHTC